MDTACQAQFSEANTDSSDLGERMRAVARAQHRFNIKTAHIMGLAPNDVWALEHLLSEGPLGPAELARRLGVTAAAMTTLLDRLEQAGHVARGQHPSDRRRLVVTPTETGRGDAYSAIAPFLTELESAEADLTPDERAVVARYLDRVIAALQAFGSPESEA
jgi:DNA-binding MarR family transcriptional regulator